MIEVEWAVGANSAFNASVQIHADNRPGTILEISALLSGLNINIQGLSGKPSSDGKFIIEMTFVVNNAEQLSYIMRNLRNLKCVNEVYRVHR